MNKLIVLVALLGMLVSVQAVTFSDRLPAGDSTNDVQQKIGVTITDANGIVRDKIVFQVDGFDFSLNDSRMSYNQATGRLEYTPIRPWNDFDPIDVYVSAEDSTGEKGELRFSFTVDKVGPLPIGFLRFDDGTIRWEKPESLSPIAKYKVYRSKGLIRDSGKSSKFLAESTELSYKDTTRESGKRYFYAVTAVDQAGNEGKIVINVTTDGEVIPTDDYAPPAPFPFPPVQPPVQPPYDGYQGLRQQPLAYPQTGMPLSGRIEFVPKGDLLVLEQGQFGNADFSITNGLHFEVTLRFEMNPASVGNGTVFLFPTQSQQLRYGRAIGFKVTPGETTFVSLPVKASENAIPGDYILSIDMAARDNEGQIVTRESSAAQVRVLLPPPLLPVQEFSAPLPREAEDEGRVEARVLEEPAKVIRIAVEDAPKKKSQAFADQPVASGFVRTSPPAGFFSLGAVTPL